MAKSTSQTTPTPSNSDAARDAIIGIAEIVLKYRGGKPDLGSIARLNARATRLLGVKSEERVQTENSATLELARRLQLI